MYIYIYICIMMSPTQVLSLYLFLFVVYLIDTCYITLETQLSNYTSIYLCVWSDLLIRMT